MDLLTIIVVILLIILVVFVVKMFNKIVKSGDANIEALKSMDLILKERLGMSSILKEIANSYDTNGTVSEVRVDDMVKELSEKMPVSDRQKLEDKFSIIFSDVFFAAQNNEELGRSETFKKLNVDLTELEKRIDGSRRHYNDTTREYNNLIKKFPYSVLASILGYSKRSFFDVDLITKEEVVIDFVDRRSAPRNQGDEAE